MNNIIYKNLAVVVQTTGVADLFYKFTHVSSALGFTCFVFPSTCIQIQKDNRDLSLP